MTLSNVAFLVGISQTPSSALFARRGFTFPAIAPDNMVNAASLSVLVTKKFSNSARVISIVTDCGSFGATGRDGSPVPIPWMIFFAETVTLPLDMVTTSLQSVVDLGVVERSIV